MKIGIMIRQITKKKIEMVSLNAVRPSDFPPYATDNILRPYFTILEVVVVTVVVTSYLDSGARSIGVPNCKHAAMRYSMYGSITITKNSEKKRFFFRDR